MSKVLKCSCKSDFQDKTYGKNMRLFNEIGKDGTGGYRCTVCGKDSKEGGSKKK